MYRRNVFTAAVKTSKVLPNCLVDERYSSLVVNRKIHVLVSNTVFRQWSSVQYRPILVHGASMITRNISGPSSWKLKRSHYATLELTPTASLKDIKNAFIQLSKQCHPDLLPEDHSKQDAERFQMVVEAYEVLSDPHRRKEYDATLGMSRKLPFQRPKTSNTQEYDEKGNKTHGPMYGVDQDFGRTINIDLSEERMQRAWEAYKIRWEREESDLRALEEKKLEFRIMLDKKREMYEALTPEEKAQFKESIRLLRHPKHFKKKGEFHHINEPQNENDPYSSYTAAFKNHILEKYNISFAQTSENKKSEVSSESMFTNTDCDNTSGTQKSNFPNRRNAFQQDSLSKYAKNVRRNLEINNSSNHTESRAVPPKKSKIEPKGVPMDNTNEPKVQSNATKSMNMKSENVDFNDEIDDIIKAMQTPNPNSEFYTRYGPAIHKVTEDEREEIRQFNETRDAWKTSKREINPDEFHEMDPDNPINYKDNIHPDHDPLMVNASNISRENTSYFKTWRKNIDEESKKSSSVNSKEGISFLQSKMFLTFAFISLISLGATLISLVVNMAGSHDVPLNGNVDKKQKSENKD